MQVSSRVHRHRLQPPGPCACALDLSACSPITSLPCSQPDATWRPSLQAAARLQRPLRLALLTAAALLHLAVVGSMLNQYYAPRTVVNVQLREEQVGAEVAGRAVEGPLGTGCGVGGPTQPSSLAHTPPLRTTLDIYCVARVKQKIAKIQSCMGACPMLQVAVVARVPGRSSLLLKVIRDLQGGTAASPAFAAMAEEQVGPLQHVLQMAAGGAADSKSLECGPAASLEGPCLARAVLPLSRLVRHGQARTKPPLTRTPSLTRSPIAPQSTPCTHIDSRLNPPPPPTPLSLV